MRRDGTMRPIACRDAFAIVFARGLGLGRAFALAGAVLVTALGGCSGDDDGGAAANGGGGGGGAPASGASGSATGAAGNTTSTGAGASGSTATGSGGVGGASAGSNAAGAGGDDANGGGSGVGAGGSNGDGGAGDAGNAGSAGAPSDAGTVPPGDGPLECDPKLLRCRMAEPPCPEGEVPRMVDGCYGPCVPIDRCECDGPDDCPHEEQYTCHMFRSRCGPYL